MRKEQREFLESLTEEEVLTVMILIKRFKKQVIDKLEESNSSLKAWQMLEAGMLDVGFISTDEFIGDNSLDDEDE